MKYTFVSDWVVEKTIFLVHQNMKKTTCLKLFILSTYTRKYTDGMRKGNGSYIEVS